MRFFPRLRTKAVEPAADVPRGRVDVLPPQRSGGQGDGAIRIKGRPGEDDASLRHTFVDYLIAEKLVSADAARSALKVQRVTGNLVGQILVRDGFITEAQLTKAILRFSPDRISAQHVAASRIPVDVLRQLRLMIAAFDSETNTLYVGSMLDERDVRPTIESYYPEKKVVFVAFAADRFESFLVEMRRTSTEVTTTGRFDLVGRITAQAIRERATDIHIEPRDDTYSLIFRKLGKRHHIDEGSRDEYVTLVTRIKDQARMDISTKRKSQDGSFQVEHAGKLIDIRATTTIGVLGEKIVLRILDSSRAPPSLDLLGISRLQHWERATRRRNGICLICGETGSGKTTTLGATLRRMDRFGCAVYTVEDPVELRLAWVTQISVNPQNGLDWQDAMKNLLRADPDVIILGEIRDPKTAKQAIVAAETGHLVLATLHTNDIVGSLARLRGIGISDSEMRALLRGALVQMLVRTICTECKGHGTVAGHVCPNPVCSGSGYGGQTIVSECAYFSEGEDIEALINGTRRPSWPSILEDAIDKMVQGVTTVDELENLFGPELEDAMKEKSLRREDYHLPGHIIESDVEDVAA